VVEHLGGPEKHGAMMQQKLKERQAEYAEMLKKPQWQKRRLQMLEAAGWKCVECGAEEQQLHVHHKRYIAGAKPWEYEDKDLVVLCERCHEKAHGRASPASKGAHRFSKAWVLLMLVLRRPEVAPRVPISAVPVDCDEGVATLAVIDLVNVEGADAADTACIVERLQGTPHGPVVAQVAARLNRQDIGDAAADVLLMDVLRRLYADDISNQIAELLHLDREAGLDTWQRSRLSGLLLEKCSVIAGKVPFDVGSGELLS
jgi:hypothetical protein